MGYQFKVGDKGKTRDGDEYEVIHIADAAQHSRPVVASLTPGPRRGPDRRTVILTHTADGKYIPGDGSDCHLDLMRPKSAMEMVYVARDVEGLTSAHESIADVREWCDAIGGITALAQVKLVDGEGLDLLDGEPSNTTAPDEPLWPGRVVYDLDAMEEYLEVDEIEETLKKGALVTLCGFIWIDTPQGEWWRSRRGPLTDETRSAIEDLLAQVWYRDGLRYPGARVKYADDIRDAISDHDACIDAFDWARTPEGHGYWSGIDKVGHDWQSRVKLKVMLLDIANRG